MEELKVATTRDGKRKFNRAQKEQIIKEVEDRANRAEVYRKYGIQEQQFYRWRHALATNNCSAPVEN